MRKKLYQYSLHHLLTAFFIMIACCTSAKDELLHPGGPGADLSQVVIPGQGKPEGANLFANGNLHDTDKWRSGFYIDPAPGLNRTTAATELRKLSKKTFAKNANGNVYAKISTPAEFAEFFKKSSGKTALSGFFSDFNLDSALQTEQEFCISFRYRGKSADSKISHGFYVVVNFYNGHKTFKSWGKYDLPLSENWRESEFRIKAPANTASLRINMGLVGAGECEFGSIVVRKVPAIQKLWAELYMMESIYPDSYELREKSASAISIAPYGKKNGSWLNLYVKLPKGIDIIGYGQFLGSHRSAKTVEKISEDASGILYRIIADRLPTEHSHFHRTGTLLLNNTLEADGKKRFITYYAEDANGKTLPKTMKLIISKGEKSPAPKRFSTGGYFTTDLVFDNDNATEALAKTYASMGFNIARCYVPQKARNIFLKHGIKRAEGIWGISDGYIFGIDPEKKTEDVLFLGMDGKPAENSRTRKEFKTGICPVILYTKSHYIETAVKPLAEQLFKDKSQDLIYSNWEPVFFDFKGCFCSRCCNEFIKFSGLPEKTVKKVWPKDVLNLYRDQWVKFRSYQHGRVIEMYVNMLDELSKKYKFKIDFAPAVHHLSAKENSGFGTQYKLDDFMDKLRVLVLWGPYLYYDYSTKYIQNIGYHLHVWNQAAFNMKYVTDRIKDPQKRPQLIALPNLQQPNKNFLTEPASAAFETLTYFVNGWNGAWPYFLPIGIDNRYWNSLTCANRQIASYEDYIFDGIKFNNYTVKEVTPLPENAVASWQTIKDPGTVPAPDTSLLQSKAFSLNGKYLFAVGNFWENGECFFKLQIKGLSAKKQWHISQPDSGKYFGSFSGAQLSKGVTLHVGSMRWAFYIIAPQKMSDCNISVNQKTVDSILKKRLSDIKKRYAKDMAIIAENAKREKAEINDVSNLPTLKNKDVVLSPEGQLLKVKTPFYTAMLDLNKGVILNSLKSADETEWSGNGALGTTRIMAPGKSAIIDKGFRLLGCEKTKNGSILVKTERRFMDGKNPELAGLILTKDIEFAKDAVLVRDAVKNGSDSEIVLSLSSHNFPHALSFKGKETGIAQMNGAVYSRCSKPWTYKIGNSLLSELQKRYNRSGDYKVINNGNVVFSAPWSKCSVTASWSKNMADFLAYWGTFDMACGTFEIHWKPFALPPGAAKTLEVKWNFINK